MEHNCCVICQSDIDTINPIDIFITTTSLGQVNLAEFLRETILGLSEDIKLRSNFVCQQCFTAINTLEDHFITYKAIQQSLLSKYSKDEDLLCMNNQNSSENESVVDNETNVVIEAPKEQIKHDSKRKGRIKNNKETNIPEERKSLRKRNSVPNYKEQIDTMTITKTHQKRHKKTANSKFERNQEDEDFPPLPNPNYCCEICGKQYLNSNGFNIHRMKHRNENLIRCEYCGKTFAQKGGLKRHLHRHTGTFPYECDKCDKKFIHQSSFKIHQDIHDGRRDHVCDICAMAFYSKTDLNRHINRHTKEKLHECSTCGAKFTEKFNLNVHIQKVHGMKK